MSARRYELEPGPVSAGSAVDKEALEQYLQAFYVAFPCQYQSVSQQSLLMFHSSTIEYIRRILVIQKPLSKSFVFIFNLNMLACCDICRPNEGARCVFRNTFRSEYRKKKIHKPRNTNLETSHSQTPQVSASKFIFFFSHCVTVPSGPGHPHYRGFTITLTYTTLGRNPLDEWSARRRDLYLTTHHTHLRQTSISRRNSNPQSQRASAHITHALDRAANGIGFRFIHHCQFRFIKLWILCLMRLIRPHT